jgi:SanA protein
MSSRFVRIFFITLLFILMTIVGGVNYAVNNSTEKQIYSNVADIPKNKVGLLLGTAKYNDRGRQIVNVYYQNRIDAAVALYMAGKIDYIIVSGYNSNRYYNEPAMMKADLVARGIPAKRIFMDDAGFRTLDSILRCRDVFGQDHFTVISQMFHNQRALYIANHKRITAIAFNAAEGDSFWDAFLREKMARVRMALDLLFNRQASYYGEKVQIP